MARSWSVFTKPWKQLAPHALGEFVSRIGFDAIEFPLRPGYQVEPERAEKDLPALQKTLGEHGVSITSVASATDERIFAACQAAGVPILRVMAFQDRALGYMQSVAKARADLAALEPLCEKYGVVVGVQPHFGFAVSSTMELHHLLEGLNPKCIAGVWDAAHSALAGELPDQALDIVWDRLCLVNLKTAYYRRANGPEAPEADFQPYFTTGRHGASSWRRIVEILIARGYQGGICMPAEYTDEANVEQYIAEDIRYAKMLFSE